MIYVKITLCIRQPVTYAITQDRGILLHYGYFNHSITIHFMLLSFNV